MTTSRSDLFREKVRQSPNNLLFRFSLAQACFEEEDFPGVIEAIQPCLEQRPDWMLARILYGRALLQQDNTSLAKQELNEALRLAHEQNHEAPAEELIQLLSEIP